MKACLILDVAHGKDTPGKESPDGTFREWRWSRDICRRMLNEFWTDEFQKDYDVTCPYLSATNEPGLTNRVKKYNEIAGQHEFTFMLSMHVNAATNPPKWWKSKMIMNGSGGIEIWTDLGHNHSDELADVFMKRMMKEAPNEFYRHNTPDDISKDHNFTVIHGYYVDGKYIPRKYEAVLLESLFMDNLTDFGKLIDPEWNREWVKIVGLSAHEVMKHKGYAN
jgi:N-acetylmuramoyl-L-alanine amidase